MDGGDWGLGLEELVDLVLVNESETSGVVNGR